MGTQSQLILASGETYVCVRGRWNYLYRAVDKHGKTVDFLLRPDRSIASAQAIRQPATTQSHTTIRLRCIDSHLTRDPRTQSNDRLAENRETWRQNGDTHFSDVASL